MERINTKEPEVVGGFIEGLVDAGLDAQLWDEIDTRPVIDNVPPLGRAEGDGAFLITSGGTTCLVILELEASNPGNERNILKWAVPDRSAGVISVQPGRDGVPKEFERVEVVLCFGREPQGEKKSYWSDSDFNKTVAHCNFLSDLLNERSDTDHLKFSVIKSTESVTDWSQFGRNAGEEFAERYMRGGSVFTGGTPS